MNKNIKVNDDGTISPIDPSKPSEFSTQPKPMTLEEILEEYWEQRHGMYVALEDDVVMANNRAIKQLEAYFAAPNTTEHGKRG